LNAVQNGLISTDSGQHGKEIRQTVVIRFSCEARIRASACWFGVVREFLVVLGVAV
jgi:hypothetical protein